MDDVILETQGLTKEPEVGQLAEVRARRWLVTQVERSSLPSSPLTGRSRPRFLVEALTITTTTIWGPGSERSIQR